MSKLSQHILGKIKEEGIKPRPRWYFVSMNVALVLAWMAAIFSGGLVMGMVFLKMSHLEWEFVRLVGGGDGPAIWDVLPLIWMILLVLVLLAAGRVFEMIEGAYKYSKWLVLAGAILISVVVGLVVYGTKISDYVDISLRGHLDIYEQMEERMENHWQIPERGLLPGRVLSHQDGAFVLEDLAEKKWQVTVDKNLIKAVNLKDNQMIMAIGEKTGEGKFKATELRLKRAFGGRKMRMKMTLPPNSIEVIDDVSLSPKNQDMMAPFPDNLVDVEGEANQELVKK